MESRNEYYTTQRIGNTLFKVRLKFAPDAHETMEDKIIHMIRNEVLEKPQNYANVPRNRQFGNRRNRRQPIIHVA